MKTDNHRKTSPFATWKQFWQLIKPHHKLIYAGILTMSLTGLTDVMEPLMTRYAIDEFIVKRDFSTFPLYIVAVIIFVFGIAFATYNYIRLNSTAMRNMANDLRQKAMHKLQNLSFSYFDVNSSGWIVARVTSDISRLSEMFAWVLADVFWGLTNMLGIIVILLLTFPKVLLLLLLLLPIYGLLSLFFSRWMLTYWRKVRHTNSIITGHFSEAILGAKTTKIMGLEDLHYQQFKKDSALMKKQSIHAATLNSIYRPLIIALVSISISLVLVSVGKTTLLGGLSVGSFMLIMNYTMLFFRPVNMIANFLSEVQLAQTNVERVLSLLNHAEDVADSVEIIEQYGTILQPTAKVKEPLYGDIVFKNVSFYYNEKEKVLTDFNLHIPKGKAVALVGETGAGKTTIANLLCRFYEPVSGEILIDGIDYRQRSLGWLHSHLGYVLQAPHLFSGTIADNIRFAKLEASQKEIEQIAKELNAHDFIMKLPKGYQTEVGEAGNLLSTGQKQLIAFIRALINNPALIVLDEATSNIDSQSEQMIQQAIFKLMQGRTSLIIAHRLSTIEACDEIIVLEHGKIIEQGTHAALLAQKGHYYQLYTNQFIQQKVNQFSQEKIL